MVQPACSCKNYPCPCIGSRRHFIRCLSPDLAICMGTLAECPPNGSKLDITVKIKRGEISYTRQDEEALETD